MDSYLPMKAYIEKLPLSFPRHLLLAGQWLGDTVHVYDVAWEYPLLMEALTALADEFYLLLSVEVYQKEADKFIHTRDAWTGKADPDQDWLEAVKRNYEAACAYIERYRERNGDGFWYAPFFSIG